MTEEFNGDASRACMRGDAFLEFGIDSGPRVLHRFDSA
jgi:hypothetical protein